MDTLNRVTVMNPGGSFIALTLIASGVIEEQPIYNTVIIAGQALEGITCYTIKSGKFLDGGNMTEIKKNNPKGFEEVVKFIEDNNLYKI